MTIRVYEAATGREGTGGDSVTITFICHGTDNELRARTATRDYLSVDNADLTTYDGKNLATLEVEERMAPNTFRLRATYSPAAGRPTPSEMQEINGGDWSFSFDGGGETALRTVSYNTVGAYGKRSHGGVDNWVDAEVDDNGGAIDVDPSAGEVRGIEVPVPSLSISVTVNMPHASISPSWINSVSDLVGCVNDRTMGPWAKGEMLLLQPSGSQSSSGDVSVTYNFQLSRLRIIPERVVLRANVLQGANHAEFKLPEILVPPHHAVWYMQTFPLLVRAFKQRMRFPQAAYVEQVYPYADFRVLGL